MSTTNRLKLLPALRLLSAVFLTCILGFTARADDEFYYGGGGFYDGGGSGGGGYYGETVVLPPFEVNSGDPATFDWDGYYSSPEYYSMMNDSGNSATTPDNTPAYEPPSAGASGSTGGSAPSSTQTANGATNLTGNSPPTGPVNATALRTMLSYNPNGRSEIVNALLHSTITTATARLLSIEAESLTSKLYPGVIPHNNAADAFRHTYWNFRMAQELGSETAKQFADAHEVSNPNPDSELLMDLWNNRQGRDLFEQNPNGDAQTVVQKAIQAGEIQTSPFVVTPGT